MPSDNTYCLIWVSLTLDMGYLFTAAPAKRSHCSLPWMRGISSRPLTDLEHGIAPLGPPEPVQPPLLGRGVSLHGSSSKAQPLLLTLDEGYILTAAPPDLERGVAPLGPTVPAQPLLLGRGVAPLGCCPSQA